MSAEVRAALAAAASTVEGINGFPYFKQASKAGTAMIRRDRTAYPDRFAGWVTWQVVVILPSDLAAAEKFMDEKVPLIVAAVASEMRVTDAIPQQFVLDNGAIQTVLIQGQREE